MRKSIFIQLLFIASLGVLETGKVARAIVVTDDPDNHLVIPQDEAFTGVVSLNFFGNQGCTGSLLKGGKHILTAAHCVTIAFEDLGLNLNDINVVFDLPQGQVSRNLSAAHIFPGWDINNFFIGRDIAVLRLSETAPDNAREYDIYRETDEIGKTANIVGYGNFGIGSTGEIEGSRGQKKIFGTNRLDALIDGLSGFFPIPPDVIPGSQLLVDFDNGLPEHDALGNILGIQDLGTTNEVLPAIGDSGAPFLIGAEIAGVVSWGLGYPFIPTDIDESINVSFGEIASSSRVSFYADWIDSVIARDSATIPEPGSDKGLLGLLVLGSISAFLTNKPK